MSQNTKKNNGFVAKVMDFLQGGEETKIARFQRKAIKHAEEQIRENVKEIENLEDQIEDANESRRDALLNVDVARIQTTEGANAFIEPYFRRIADIDAQLDRINTKISGCRDQIDKYKAIVNSLK